ncbi:MAG TPA: hypothetical protein DCE62_08245 [Glaciecola sp.]|jgi:hypothetical protein|nr:hypothetical protein [Glaciecola sp.]
MSQKSCLGKLDENQRVLIAIRKISVCHLCVFGSFSDVYKNSTLVTEFDGCSLKTKETNDLRYDCSDFEPDPDLNTGDCSNE